MALPRRRHLLPAVVLVLAACGPGPEPKAAGAASSCSGPRMRTCERDLAKVAASGDVPASLVKAYVTARAAEDGADPWAKVWEGLADRRGAHAAVVDARPAAGAITAGSARVIATPALPDPPDITGADLLLAMGTAAGYEHVVWLGAGDGKRAFELYPKDPLGPQMLGLRPVARDDAAGSHLEASLALAEAVRSALGAAGDFRYVDAAKEAERLTERIRDRDPFEEPVLRARYARALLSAAGLTLEAPVSLFGDETPAPPARKIPEVPAPADGDTVYGDLLRVRVADEVAVEWKRRGPRVLAAIPADRRAAVDAFFGPPAACDVLVDPPDFTRADDVALSGLLPGALAGAREEPIVTASPKGLPLAAWYPRYERLVAHVDRARFAWLHIPSLLRQRGELPGIRPSGTATYRRVTELGLRHIGALRELSLTDPQRYQATAELGLAVSGGLLGDEPLRGALIDFTQATAKSKLGRAEDPGAIAGTLLASGFVGLTYPPAIQAAHYLALQSAFAAKVKGDLMSRTGWGTAALFAADAILRVAFDLGPNLAFSSDQIVRALSDPGIAQPNLAALAAAAARYAALAKDRPLAAIATAAQSTPERAAAREALRKAIAGMGAPGEAPPALADEITGLADGLIATLSVVLHRKPAPPGTCAAGKTAADIEIEHALTKLRAARQKILQSPRFKGGDGLWARRARLLVALLSDGMDFAAPSRPDAKRSLTLSAPEVEAALSAALREWDEPGARDAIVGLYSLARFFLSGDAAARFSGGGPFLVRALGGIGRFLRGGGAAELPTMLDALAQMSGKQGGADDIASALFSYSKSFYDRGQPDQGDVFLLGTLLITQVRKTPPPREAIELAAAHRSRIGWALSLFAEVAAAEANGRPNVAAYAAEVRRSAGSLCSPGRADDVLDAMGAVAHFTDGKRKEARAALDAVLARADAEGLVVPRVNYQYAEKHDKKVFTLSFGITHGVGLVDGANSFQIGVGLSTLAERKSKLTVSAASADETAIETARWYVRVAALAAAYHFLDGDAVAGAVAARRAVSAIVTGVRLGSRSVMTDRGRWAEDARALLALDAQLAADAGLPFLSGDLWTIVKDSLPRDADDAKIAEVLASRPLGLVDVKDADAPIERAKRSLRVVAAPLACTAAKVETVGFDQATCAAYPLALALRVADVLSRMPRLKRGADAAQGSCAALSSLDTFLEAAARGSYDPDAFTRSVEELRSSGREDEAAALLARQRRDGHCSPKLLAASRALGRSQALLPGSRADMLTVAVNCAGADAGADLEKDLAALDAETRKLADPMRNLKVMLFAADLALRVDRPQLLLSLVRAPGFVDRFLPISGNAVAFALVLHHAALTLAGEALDPAPTEATFSLVCGSFPSADRRFECDEVAALRDGKIAQDARKKLAKDAIGKLLEPSPKAPPGKP